MFVATPSQCHINLGAIRRNYRYLCGKGALMPVIKANAYGHGLLPVAKALAAEGAMHFAVGGVDEGRELRENGLNQKILLLLGCADDKEWKLAVQHNLLPLVGGRDDLLMARRIAREKPEEFQPIAIKCDTGMSRLGFNLEDAPALLDYLAETPNLIPTLLVSHLACADMPEEMDFTQKQIRLFSQFYNALRTRYPDIGLSLGNSALTLASPQKASDLLRPGIALYGASPFSGEVDGNLELAMSLAAPILHVRDLKPGQSISYGRTFTAEKPMRVAVAACGYATGISRNLSNRVDFVINGKRAPQRGNICMSMLMLDVTNIEDVKKGDNAWLLATPFKNGEKPLNAIQLAARLNTIPYEILCLIGSLNPAKYYDD